MEFQVDGVIWINSYHWQFTMTICMQNRVVFTISDPQIIFLTVRHPSSYSKGRDETDYYFFIVTVRTDDLPFHVDVIWVGLWVVW